MSKNAVIYVETDALIDAARRIAGGCSMQQTPSGTEIALNSEGSGYARTLQVAGEIARDLRQSGHTARVV